MGCQECVLFGLELGSKMGLLSCGLLHGRLVTRCEVAQLFLELRDARFQLRFANLEQGETVVALKTCDLVRAGVVGAFQDG